MTEIKNKKFNELKMLIFDDSNTLGMIIKDILVTLGVKLENIEQVGDAYDALNILGSKKFDLMSSNLWMPSSRNGLELLDKIRSQKIKIFPLFSLQGKPTISL
jgi:CheY-like chemotaxis protein